VNRNSGDRTAMIFALLTKKLKQRKKIFLTKQRNEEVKSSANLITVPNVFSQHYGAASFMYSSISNVDAAPALTLLFTVVSQHY
jgi:hypothetical protein